MAEDNQIEKKQERYERRDFERDFGLKIKDKSLRETFRSYFSYAKSRLPKVENVIKAAKKYIETAREKISKTKIIAKQAKAAAKAGRAFAGCVYDVLYAEELKKFSKTVLAKAQSQYQSLKQALSSGIEGVRSVIVSYRADKIQSGMVKIKERKKSDAGKGEALPTGDGKPSRAVGNQDETRSSAVNAKVKNVAQNQAAAELSMQEARETKKSPLIAEGQKRGQKMLQQEVYQREQEKIQKQRQEEKRRRQEKSRKQQEERNKKLAAEIKKREEEAKRQETLRVKEKKQVETLEAKNKEVNDKINSLATQHNENNVRRVKLDSLRQRIQQRNRKEQQHEAGQTMIMDWSQNKDVEKSQAKMQEAQKEAEKTIAEVKSKVSDARKEALLKMQQLSGRSGGTGALRNSFAQAGKNLEISGLASEMKDKVQKVQEEINHKMNSLDNVSALTRDKDAKIPEQAFKAPAEAEMKQIPENVPGQETENNREERVLTPEEVKQMMRQGINPRDKAQVERAKAEKSMRRNRNKNRNHDGTERFLQAAGKSRGRRSA